MKLYEISDAMQRLADTVDEGVDVMQNRHIRIY